MSVNGNVWMCRIGPAPFALPEGSDDWMRSAIEKGFFELFGEHAEAKFTGWGDRFTESEAAVIENRLPNPNHPDIKERLRFLRTLDDVATFIRGAMTRHHEEQDYLLEQIKLCKDVYESQN